MIRSKRLWAGLAAGSLILAACGNDDDGGSEASAADDTTPEENAAATAEAAPDGATEFTLRIENTSDGFGARTVETFAVPVGADEAGPAVPGGSYEVSFGAAPGERLSFATMFVQSNDWFFAPPAEGIALFDDAGAPLTGDITDQILVLDGGTEVDQEPGVGADQAPRQAGPDTGDADPDETVRVVDGRDAAAYVSVNVDYADGTFTLRIDNVSETASTPTPLSPGVAVVHGAGTPLYELGAPDFGLGLEGIAEDGDPAALADSLTATAGVTTPLAPGVAIVHADGTPLFDAGSPDRGEGLEALAEDGVAQPLADAVSAELFAVPTGETEPGPALPGTAYEVTVAARPGDRLSFATMLVQSNDWFFAPEAGGLALFDADGNPVSGDITSQVLTWDAGTEIDQEPGTGPDQAPRQAGPDTGDPDGNDAVRTIDLSPAGTIVVTLTPAG